jgi:hypothetical protein
MEGVELIVSVETSQLDREAICEIASELPAEAVLRPRDAQELVLEEAEVNEPHSRTVASNQPVGLFVYRLAAVPLSYAEMVHPLAAWQVQMARDTSQRELVRSTFRIFPERLEKGVLRRGQFRGYFLPREGDLDAARVLYREFAASDLPLTT